MDYESVRQQTRDEWCTVRGFKPQLQRTGNETPKDVEDFIESQNAEVQYSPTGSHCPPAEKAVQTYKACCNRICAIGPGEKTIKKLM